MSQFLVSQGGYEILLGSRKQREQAQWLPGARVFQTQWDSPRCLEGVCTAVDVVVHLAGMNAQDCMVDPIGALEVNAVATARLLRSAIRQGVKRFIYLSTAHVYRNPLVGTITEETCPVNLHPYATSHHAGEDLVRAAHQRGEIEGIVIRLSNAYGAPAHQTVNCWMLLVNDLCRQAITTQKMILHSSGLQRRDFITLTDACKAINHLMALSASKLGNGLFNVSGSWSPTVLEMTERMAERIHHKTGSKPSILRRTDQNTESTELLDYRMTKLLDTGFCINNNNNVDQEIDTLIQFCLEHI